MAEMHKKIPDYIAEKVLGHQLQGVQAIYNHHEYFEEKSEASQKLADHIETIVTPTARPRRRRAA
jgi:hypothetical protein